MGTRARLKFLGMKDNMSDLKNKDKQLLEKLFQMEGGYVLNFIDRTISEFFEDELSIFFFDEKYNYKSGSKANRMRGFWKVETNEIVGKSILRLIDYIENAILLNNLTKKDYPEYYIRKAINIANQLLGNADIHNSNNNVKVETNTSDGNINITLNEKVFSHVRPLLMSGHYSNAVEESYKIVRAKLKEITGKEKAHEAFKEENFSKIFKNTDNKKTKDFREGVKFLHMLSKISEMKKLIIQQRC